MIVPLSPQVIRVTFPAPLLIRIRIKALRITRISNMRNNRSSIFPVVDVIPIHTMEERVIFDTLCAAGDISEAF
jgi:hypothetical protein